ncbi:mobilome CxxCx(11)CxxC protein [Photobacterium iliopiscarium]|uniref:mobilome CxxCx(11)CxxC protein n=1 Tax=Photobacterium iliopiscarium TaxID=56192 RepID=UPI0015E76EB3|nr:mobilome CxxCx(11)CxxC protein [Photobacterium iliopiscarium]
MGEENFKKECFKCEFYSFGTSKIFEKRVDKYGCRLKAITFLGLLSPVLLGGFVASFSVESALLKNSLLPVCGSLTIFQAILSLLSLVCRWDETYSYAIGSVRNNTMLMNDFSRLKNTNAKVNSKRFQLLTGDYDRQNNADIGQNISTKEMRYAMRQSLFQYKSECRTCGIKPISLKPSKCDTCGNF